MTFCYLLIQPRGFVTLEAEFDLTLEEEDESQNGVAP